MKVETNFETFPSPALTYPVGLLVGSPLFVLVQLDLHLGADGVGELGEGLALGDEVDEGSLAHTGVA